MIKQLLLLPLLFVTTISLASEKNPLPDSLQVRLLQIAYNWQVDPKLIGQYEKFVVKPTDIEKIQKLPTEICGQEPYVATLKDGNQIAATYYSCGRDKRHASVYVTHYIRDTEVFYLPISLGNFHIIKQEYLKRNLCQRRPII